MKRTTLKEIIGNRVSAKAWRSLNRTTTSPDKWLENQLTRCNAINRTGLPCKMRAVNGTSKCLMHGGASTGPKTPEGKAKALANLKQYRNKEK